MSEQMIVNLAPTRCRMSRNAEPGRPSLYARRLLSSFAHISHLTCSWHRRCQFTFSWVPDAVVLVPLNIIVKANAARSFCFASATSNCLCSCRDLSRILRSSQFLYRATWSTERPNVRVYSITIFSWDIFNSIHAPRKFSLLERWWF
jgi:hypothetical protein